MMNGSSRCFFVIVGWLSAVTILLASSLHGGDDRELESRPPEVSPKPTDPNAPPPANQPPSPNQPPIDKKPSSKETKSLKSKSLGNGLEVGGGLISGFQDDLNSKPYSYEARYELEEDGLRGRLEVTATLLGGHHTFSTIQGAGGPDPTVISIVTSGVSLEGPFTIQGIIGYQGCTDGSCDQPRGIQFQTELKIGNDPESGPIAASIQAIPFKTVSTNGNLNKWIDEEGVKLTLSGSEIWTEFCLARLGGLILNFMACVLPVIGLKVLDKDRMSMLSALMFVWFACWMIGRVPAWAEGRTKMKAWLISTAVTLRTSLARIRRINVRCDDCRRKNGHDRFYGKLVPKLQAESQGCLGDQTSQRTI